MATDHRNIFCSSWTWGISKKVLRRNLYRLLKIRVLQNLFPNCRPVHDTESDTVNSSANLSAWRCLANQSMIPDLVSWNGAIKSMSPGFATLPPSPAPYSNSTSSFFKKSLWTLSLLVCLVMGKLLFCHPYVWASGQNPTWIHKITDWKIFKMHCDTYW